MREKNISQLRRINPNARAVDGLQGTILHLCATYAWVEGVQYLTSNEPKPNLAIKDSVGGSEVSPFAANCPIFVFESRRFIKLELGTRIPKIAFKRSNSCGHVDIQRGNS